MKKIVFLALILISGQMLQGMQAASKSQSLVQRGLSALRGRASQAARSRTARPASTAPAAQAVKGAPRRGQSFADLAKAYSMPQRTLPMARGLHSDGLSNEEMSRIATEELNNKINSRYMDSQEILTLIQHGANVNSKDEDGNFLIHKVANPNIAEILIENGANVDAKNEHGNTRLHTAALFDESDIARVLINGGANVNARNKYLSKPLDLAQDQDSLTASIIRLHGGKKSSFNKKAAIALLVGSLLFEEYQMRSLMKEIKQRNEAMKQLTKTLNK